MPRSPFAKFSRSGCYEIPGLGPVVPGFRNVKKANLLAPGTTDFGRTVGRLAFAVALSGRQRREAASTFRFDRCGIRLAEVWGLRWPGVPSSTPELHHAPEPADSGPSERSRRVHVGETRAGSLRRIGDQSIQRDDSGRPMPVRPPPSPGGRRRTWMPNLPAVAPTLRRELRPIAAFDLNQRSPHR
jgi:hypothetical protein